MPPQRILIIGDYDHRDFAPAVAWLRFRSKAVCAREAEEALKHSDSAELILFAQARPGRFRQSDVERLHRRSPLARLAVLLGTWCEGEMRTDTPLAGVLRFYWHEWEVKLGPLWDSDGEVPTWSLPRTTLPGERTLAASSPGDDAIRELVAVRALGAVSYAGLADALRAGGYSSVWLDPRQPFRTRPAVLLWEGDVGRAPGREELSRLTVAVRPAPTFVLANFPRPEELRTAQAAGAADVIGKPLVVSDLVRRLRSTLRRVE